MHVLTLLYDPTCGLCRRVHGWLAEQPKLLELRMIPIQTDAARRRFPKLNHQISANVKVNPGRIGSPLRLSGSSRHSSGRFGR